MCKYRIEKRISKQNKEYYILILEFDNGYVCELFVNDEKAYCITH